MIADFTKNYEKLLTATQLLKEVSEDLKLYGEDALKEITSEQQDLLHIIENGTANGNDHMKIDIVNHLQTVRHVRRNIKKLMEMSEILSTPLTTFLTSFQTSKHQLIMMKNSFDTPIYRIRNQHIYQAYLENNATVTIEEQPNTMNEQQQPITYVKNEQELVAQIKEKNNEKLQKQQLPSNQEDNFEKLLTQQNIIEENNKFKQENIELLEKQTKNNKRKSKKKKAKALKQLKALKNKENKQTVLDLFKELEQQRRNKK